MKQLLRSAAYRLTSKRVDESKLETLNIQLTANDVSYFNLSSNPILSFIYEDKLCYFRECPRLCTKREWFLQAIEAFFETIGHLGISKEHFKQEIPIKLDFSDGETATFRSLINSKKQDKAFMKRLSKADKLCDKYGFSLWDGKGASNDLLEEFGFAEKDISVYFLWYMRSAAIRYRTLRIVRGKTHSFFCAVRSVASKMIAETLGVGGMITQSRFCVLNIDGKETLGVLSESANGTRAMDTDITPSVTLQRELTNLHALDIICNQPDHGPNNYNVTPSGSVCAFDNDNEKTFFPFFSVNCVCAACASFVDKNGRINRPSFDKALAESITTVDLKSMDKMLKPYLNYLQRAALKSRLKRLRKAILCSDSLLLDSDVWSLESLNEEINGKYGKTYLTRLLKKGV